MATVTAGTVCYNGYYCYSRRLQRVLLLQNGLAKSYSGLALYLLSLQLSTDEGGKFEDLISTRFNVTLAHIVLINPYFYGVPFLVRDSLSGD